MPQAAATAAPAEPAARKPASLVPEVPAATRLSTAVAAQVPRAAAAGSVPIRNLAPKVKKANPAMKWVKIGVTLIVVGVGAAVGLHYLSIYQDKANEKRRAEEKKSDGGELGHVANLYQTLDKTDPNRAPAPSAGAGGPMGDVNAAMDASSTLDAGSSGGSTPGRRAPNANPGANVIVGGKALPTVPPVWTLDAAKANIAESKVNGTISGTNFVAESARLDRTANGYVLSLYQGALLSPDAEVIVYLHPGGTAPPAGRTFNVAPDAKDPGVSSVMKRWKRDPHYAPSSKPFSSGYVLKLEFGAMSPENTTIPGKIYLALPDTEQTVVAGMFTAAANTAEPAAQPQAQPAASPYSSANKAGADAFRARYGTPSASKRRGP